MQGVNDEVGQVNCVSYPDSLSIAWIGDVNLQLGFWTLLEERLC